MYSENNLFQKTNYYPLSYTVEIMKTFVFYIVLAGSSVSFLVIEHLTHMEFMMHLAAIPLEVLLCVFIVEKFLEKGEKKERQKQLMFIKSYLFRAEMLNLFITNFEALKRPPIKMSTIRDANLGELKQIRRDADTIEYKSLEVMEPIIMEYVKLEHVWLYFRERAITSNFENIFHDMIYILHFIADVKIFKDNNPDKFFIYEAEKNALQMEKTNKILSEGIQKFLDFAIELKEKHPNMFHDLISNCEISLKSRCIKEHVKEFTPLGVETKV